MTDRTEAWDYERLALEAEAAGERGIADPGVRAEFVAECKRQAARKRYWAERNGEPELGCGTGEGPAIGQPERGK